MERFHFYAGTSPRPHPAAYVQFLALIHPPGTRALAPDGDGDTGDIERVAEGNDRPGLLDRHRPGDDGRLDHGALFGVETVGLQDRHDLGTEHHAALGFGYAVGDVLVAHVHHAGVAFVVEMSQCHS